MKDKMGTLMTVLTPVILMVCLVAKDVTLDRYKRICSNQSELIANQRSTIACQDEVLAEVTNVFRTGFEKGVRYGEIAMAMNPQTETFPELTENARKLYDFVEVSQPWRKILEDVTAGGTNQLYGTNMETVVKYGSFGTNWTRTIVPLKPGLDTNEAELAE